MKTVNDLFILDIMKACKILAGHRGLERTVQFVNILDTPDAKSFLKRDHMLLTTGYAFKDDTRGFCELIREMNNNSCAGIVIKLHRFHKVLPEEVKVLADDLSLPIIELPLEFTLGEVSQHILNYLNNDKAEELFYAIHIHQKFSEMMVKEYSLGSLVEQLGHFLKRPSLLLNQRGETLALSHDFQKDSMNELKNMILDLINDHKEDARNGASFDIVNDQNEPVQSITTFPVVTKHQTSSILVIVDAHTLPYPASKLAIEQASNVISFTLIKQQAIEENAKQFKNNFFADLIDERITSEDEILSIGKHYGLEKQKHYICAVCQLDAENFRKDHDNKIQEETIGKLHNLVYDFVEDELAQTNIKGILFTKEKYYVMLFQFLDYNPVDKNEISAFFRNVQTESPEQVSFGVSSPVQSIKDIPTAYREAIETIKHGYELNKEPFIQYYKIKEFTELLQMIPKKHLKEFCHNTLNELANASLKEDIELLKTLEVFLNCQGEISETSRKMYIHRNTVKYRINKCEQMTKCSLDDPEDTLRLRVALLAMSLL
ncbi:PucR family transcriptional regulator [Scopulibacillus darangshiensis]|uniref:PucR family transcriptional regulator n=1 Tax=Scopulibacillus darangshiensis TaxID=442528 RepID=A0A4R2NJQ3_9BACL|nr:PucR family transcriptional regulator [Scopulibacillus darangshiensis]TCP21671.1 PucR family transcriptional regulator [Scopulibacillus darangshiensis]